MQYASRFIFRKTVVFIALLLLFAVAGASVAMADEDYNNNGEYYANEESYNNGEANGNEEGYEYNSGETGYANEENDEPGNSQQPGTPPGGAAAVSALGAFTDINPGHWSYNYVNTVVSRGLFLGTSETTFSPNGVMTRGMFVTVLARLSNATLDNNQQTRFTDVPSGQFFTGAVAWGTANGIIHGRTETSFAPNEPITREDMV